MACVFLIQVVGNMGDALEAANPNIKTVLTKCMRQPATTLAVQLAAIQAFRRMPVTDEVNKSPFAAMFINVFLQPQNFLDNRDDNDLFCSPGSLQPSAGQPVPQRCCAETPGSLPDADEKPSGQ